MNSGSWWWTGRPGVLVIHGVAKSWTWLSNWTELKKQIDFSHIFNLPNSASEFEFTESQYACVSILNIEFKDPCESSVQWCLYKDSVNSKAGPRCESFCYWRSWKTEAALKDIVFKHLVLCVFQRRQWHPTPVLLPGKSHGRRSLVGCSP